MKLVVMCILQTDKGLCEAKISNYQALEFQTTLHSFNYYFDNINTKRLKWKTQITVLQGISRVLRCSSFCAVVHL